MGVMQLGLVLGVAVCVQLVPAIATAETRVSATAGSIQVNANNSTLEEVLTKLQTDFSLTYRSFVPLMDHVTGNFEGSLQQVVVRVLNGYDYVIKRSEDSIDILVLRKNKDSVAQQGVPVGPSSDAPSPSATEPTSPPAANKNASNQAWLPPPAPNQDPVAAALYVSVRNQVPGSNTFNDPPPPMDAAQMASLTQSTTAAVGRLRDALISLPR
jgi:hypothetical protein